MDQEEQILRLQSLFRGNPRVIGQASNDLIQDEKDPDKLNQSRRGFVQGPATDVHWKDHLEGKVSLGLVPIDDYSYVKFMAIDVDLDIMSELNLTLVSIYAQVEANNLPFIVCRSKSGACHLFVFFTEQAPVAPVRKAMMGMADFLGLNIGKRPAEYFPHTSKLDITSNGKYINLPYFNSEDTNRFAITASGSSLSLNEFIHLAESKMVSKESFCKWKAPLSSTDNLRDVVVNGPPCLQTIYDQGLQDGTKNDILLQFGILFKKYNKNTYMENVSLINQTRTDKPHDGSDLETTLKQLKKKDFHYNCSHPCMAPICAKSLCMSRKYGIKAAVDFPEIKEIIQWGANDEYFEIVLAKTESREEVKFKIEAERIFSFDSMQTAVLQAIHIVLPVPKKFDWMEFITTLATKIRRVEVSKEFSIEHAIRTLILERATSRTVGNKLEDLMVKRPVLVDGYIIIRHRDFMEEMARRGLNKNPDYSTNIELSVIQEMGGEFTAIMLGSEATPILKIPNPKINQEEVLEKVSQDFETKY